MKFLRKAVFAGAVGDPHRSAFPVGGSARIDMEFLLPQQSRRPVAGVVARRAETGETVFGTNSRTCGQPELGQPLSEINMSIQMAPLNLVPGRYLLDVWVGKDQEDLEVQEAMLELEILDNDPHGTGRPVFTHFGPCFIPMKYEARPPSV